MVSGAQKRKEKRKREEEMVNARERMAKFLKRDSKDTSALHEGEQGEPCVAD